MASPKLQFSNEPVPRPWAAWASTLLVLMVLYGVVWESVLDPIRPGSWLWLKVLPLAMLLPGIWRGEVKRFQAMSLLIWIYLCEALVRVLSPHAAEAWLSAIWLLLGLALAVVVVMGARASRLRASSAPRES